MKKIINFSGRDFLGYRLRYIPKNDVWQFYAGKLGTWEGSLKEVLKEMHWGFEINNKEIRLALSEMDKNKHFVASFGMLGTFICTLRK